VWKHNFHFRYYGVHEGKQVGAQVRVQPAVGRHPEGLPELAIRNLRHFWRRRSEARIEDLLQVADFSSGTFTLPLPFFIYIVV